MNLTDLGKILLFLALFLFLFGITLYLLGRGMGLQRLPGDIFYQKGRFSFYFPLGASIVISLILTLALNLIFFLRR